MTSEQAHTIILKRIEKVENEILKLKEKIIQVEKDKAVDEVHRQNVERRLTAIEDNTKKLIWLIIGGLLSGVMMFIVGGGLGV